MNPWELVCCVGVCSLIVDILLSFTISVLMQVGLLKFTDPPKWLWAALAGWL